MMVDSMEQEPVSNAGSQMHTQKKLLPRLISFSRRRPLRVLIVLLILLGVIFSLYVGAFRLWHGFYPWSSDEDKAKVELASTVSAASKLMVLPQGEPIMATVVDASVLKSQQQFFNNAEDGDQLLIFPDSAQAIIYSPSRNRIVNVGPIQYGGDQAGQPAVAGASTDQAKAATPATPAVEEKNNDNFSFASSTAASESDQLTVSVRNGGGVNGMASTLAERIKTKGEYDVIAVGDAASANYVKTVVVDLSADPDKAKVVSALAADIGATVISDIPNGESADQADVLVIIGSDYKI